MPSIRDSWEHRQALIQEADQLWDELAVELSTLIPSSLATFAVEYGWVKHEDGQWWKLPEFLGHLAGETKRGNSCSDKFTHKDLASYGFHSFEALETALRELEAAWSGLIRIKIDKRERHRWTVYFYASELLPSKTT